MEELRLVIERKCPYCRRQVYSERETKATLYGSPIRSCQCGKDYLDIRYHEIALTGIEPKTLNFREDILILLFIVPIMLVTVMALMHNLSKLIAFLLVEILMIIIAIWDIIQKKKGENSKRFSYLRAESEKRLSNPEYIHRLQAAGYHIPDRMK